MNFQPVGGLQHVGRVGRGGTARDPVSWERGDAKIKQKRNTNGSGGKSRESSSSSGGKGP